MRDIKVSILESMQELQDIADGKCQRKIFRLKDGDYGFYGTPIKPLEKQICLLFGGKSDEERFREGYKIVEFEFSVDNVEIGKFGELRIINARKCLADTYSTKDERYEDNLKILREVGII